MKLTVYDVLGREVTILVDELLNVGSYRTVFDGTDFSSGVYFYKLETDDYNDTKKMVLVK